ncbi:MAG: hypothetical protein O2780_21825 [Proteobacteria bacterium]|nr:hypothetical protein [Pseudomonadota bacterium]MDA1301908.1 hypothetical protein [Pseudomonadota bacterium]
MRRSTAKTMDVLVLLALRHQDFVSVEEPPGDIQGQMRHIVREQGGESA